MQDHAADSSFLLTGSNAESSSCYSDHFSSGRRSEIRWLTFQQFSYYVFQMVFSACIFHNLTRDLFAKLFWVFFFQGCMTIWCNPSINRFNCFLLSRSFFRVCGPVFFSLRRVLIVTGREVRYLYDLSTERHVKKNAQSATAFSWSFLTDARSACDFICVSWDAGPNAH